jgi:bifunctional DNA-binding transcriptional regulator/antitoxin component of YhaV-PrlF toxin-antitoxin module
MTVAGHEVAPMHTATIGPDGEVTIPLELLAQVGLEPGAKYLLEPEGGRIVLRPWPADLIEYLTGSLKDGPSLTAELMREHAEELRRDEERFGPLRPPEGWGGARGATPVPM